MSPVNSSVRFSDMQGVNRLVQQHIPIVQRQQATIQYIKVRNVHGSKILWTMNNDYILWHEKCCTIYNFLLTINGQMYTYICNMTILHITTGPAAKFTKFKRPQTIQVLQYVIIATHHHFSSVHARLSVSSTQQELIRTRLSLICIKTTD